MLFTNDYYKPTVFDLSDEEFFEVISQKEVYGIFETRQWILRNHEQALIDLKETVEKILAALDGL